MRSVPPHRLRHRRAGLALACGALLACSCAKFPEGGITPDVQRLVFKMTVERELKPSYVYIVALRISTDDNPIGSGPIPVVAPPWGNGFVAGNATHYVRWDAATSPQFLIYEFQDGSLINSFPTGAPIAFTPVQAGDKTLEFEVSLDQLESPSADLRSIQVNFLTMDKVPTGTQAVTKNWDALGDGRVPSQVNTWITIPVRTSGLYDNARFGNLEPQGDAPDPDLEITDFSVEVRL